MQGCTSYGRSIISAPNLARSLPLQSNFRTLHVDRWAYDVQLGNVVAESKVLLTRMVETLFDHAHRWENIEMLLPESAALSFYNNINPEYPYLTSFKLGTRSLSIKRNFIGRNRFLLSAPNVKELALPGRVSVTTCFHLPHFRQAYSF